MKMTSTTWPPLLWFYRCELKMSNQQGSRGWFTSNTTRDASAGRWTTQRSGIFTIFHRFSWFTHFVDFHHFSPIFTIYALCRFSPFLVDFHHFSPIFVIYALCTFSPFLVDFHSENSENSCNPKKKWHGFPQKSLFLPPLWEIARQKSAKIAAIQKKNWHGVPLRKSIFDRLIWN